MSALVALLARYQKAGQRLSQRRVNQHGETPQEMAQQPDLPAKSMIVLGSVQFQLPWS